MNNTYDKHVNDLKDTLDAVLFQLSLNKKGEDNSVSNGIGVNDKEATRSKKFSTEPKKKVIMIL